MKDRLKQIKEIWDLSQYGFSKEVQAAGEEMREWLRAQSNDLTSYLFGIPEKLPSDDSLRTVAKEILKQFAPLKKSCQCTQVLSAVIKRGNEIGVYNICPPPISIYIKRDSSPFLLKDIPKLALVSKWQKCLWASVEPVSDTEDVLQKNNSADQEGGDALPCPANQSVDLAATASSSSKSIKRVHPWHKDPWQVNLGRVLASAALHGGLCHSSFLLALYEKLTSPLELINDISSMSFDLVVPKQPGSEFRRWFPDALTEMLYLRLPESTLAVLEATHANVKPVMSDVSTCIKMFFKAYLPKNDKAIPKNASAFVNTIHFQLATRLPMFLVTYACRRCVNHSIKPEAWKRIYGKMDRVIESLPEEKLDSMVEFDSDATEFDHLLPSWFATVKEALQGKNLSLAKGKIAMLHESFKMQSSSALNTVFSGWAWLMTHKGSASGNALALSTIRGYFSQVGQRVLGHSANLDLTTLPVNAFQEIYTQILEDAEGRHQRIKLAKGLREFHHYLAQIYQVEAISYSEVLGIGAAFNPVDANLITPEEFKAILDSPIISNLDISKTSSDHPDVKTIARLILILAFRSGLRRREILGLEVRDLLAASPCELLIRPHDHRSLKTKSSSRKPPLYALLPEDELAELINWQQKRLSEIKGKPGPHFLFAVADWRDLAISPDRIFDLLHNAIRTTTGDNSLKFHHLRHSFATWTLLQMMMVYLERQETSEQRPCWHEFFETHPEIDMMLGRAMEFVGTLMLPTGSTRKYLFADASLLGHAGPEMSLEHYVHCCDILLKLFLARQGVNPERPTIINASGLPYSSAHRHFKKEGLRGVLAAVRNAARSRTAICPDPKKKVISSQEPEVQPLAIKERLNNLWLCLHQLSEGKNKEQLVRRFGYTHEQLDLMAEAMRDLKEEKIYDRQFIHQASYGKNGNRRDFFPPPWPERIGSNFFETYAAPVWALFAQDKDLTRWGVVYYLKHAWKEKHFVIFKDPTDRQSASECMRFLYFLERIGIRRSMIKFVRMDKDTSSRYLLAWQRLLGLTSNDTIVFKAPPNTACDASKRWLGIAPQFKEDGKAPRTARGAEVFRFTLMMAFVDFRLTAKAKNAAPEDHTGQ